MSSPHPWPGSAQPVAPPPSQPPAGPGVPVPPVTVLAAAGLALLGIVCLVLATAVADLGDLFTRLEWRSVDESMFLATLSVVVGAGLLAGAVAALFRRGGGLLRLAGIALAVLAVAVLVAELIQDADVTRTISSALVAALGVAVGLLAGMAPSRRWYESGERAAAERAIARAVAPGTAARAGHIAGRGIGWALVAAAFGVAVVAAAGLVVAQAAPPVVSEGQGGSWLGEAAQSGQSGQSDGAEEAEEIPVDRSDYDWDSQLNGLAESCADGSFSSCDDLYWESDVGSDYEDYGSTCGGRTAIQQRGDCVVLFD